MLELKGLMTCSTYYRGYHTNEAEGHINRKVVEMQNGNTGKGPRKNIEWGGQEARGKPGKESHCQGKTHRLVTGFTYMILLI